MSALTKTIDGMADQVADVIGGVLRGPAVVVGLSLGGCVAQSLGSRFPHLISSLGLLDTTSWYGPEGSAIWDARIEQASQLGMDALAGLQPERWFVDPETPLGFGLIEVFRATPLDAFAASCSALGSMDLRDAAASIRAPTTILVGALDSATPPDSSLELWRRIPGAGLHVVRHGAHLMPLENPDLVAHILRCDLLRQT
jgi:3-oxoadipate enol-lactonase